MPPIPINLAVEDALSDVVLRRLIAASAREYAVGFTYSRGGFGYLKRITPGLNNAAKGTPFVLLTDLDREACAPALLADWLHVARHHNFLFRVAVREVEAWLLADRPGLAKYLLVRQALIPEEVDNLADPKATLLSLVAKSPKRELKVDLLPRRGSTTAIGPNYNGRLSHFVLNNWNVAEAGHRSPSLARTMKVLREFRPVWEAD